MGSEFLAPLQHRIEQALTTSLSQSTASHYLTEAMRYATLNGGKRLRAALVYMGCEALELDLELGDSTSLAIELVHAYSLVHDDLPAMDDDDLRRGKPTTHIQFDEATAILAGDALQSLAFQQLATDGQLSTDVRLELIVKLSAAIGPDGMVGGQSLDMLAEGAEIELDALQNIHARKTGALIQFAATAPGIIAGRHQAPLAAFGSALGIAFQIQDDILDATGDDQALGKRSGADARQSKSTYVSLLGIDRAQDALQRMLEQSRQSLDDINLLTPSFDQLIHFIAHRDY